MKRHGFIGLVGPAAVRAWLVAVIWMSAVAGAHAQATQSDNEAKIIRCRQNATELIWLDRAALRARCGMWSHVNTTSTTRGVREQVVYNRHFYVYLHNGVVSGVRKKRQIFTGFKLRP
jgi:hypothetical protein